MENTNKILFGLVFAMLMLGIFAESVSSTAKYNGKCKVQVYTYGYYPKQTDARTTSSKTYYGKIKTNIIINDFVKANKWRTEVYVEPGKVEITVTKNRYLTHFVEPFQCSAGEFVRKNVELKLDGCIVELRVVSGGANIAVDGKYLGRYYAKFSWFLSEDIRLVPAILVLKQ